MKKVVWVCGEALIDLIPDGSGSKAIVGGGPANTARALSRLGIKTQFINGISRDNYGKMIIKELHKSGVIFDFVNFSEKPTALAIVELEKSGNASYKFLFEGTATFDFSHTWLPDPTVHLPSVLHIGTLATVIQPASSILFDWAKKVSLVTPIVFDPNIRPTVLNDPKIYSRSVENWVSLSSAVKVSEDDLKWLYSDLTIETVIQNWLKLGPKLIVVTFGEKGLTGFTNSEVINENAARVDVLDTIGAGDTVGAILVEAILETGLSNLDGENLAKVLKKAALAAAITVSRVGANTPTQDELKKLI